MNNIRAAELDYNVRATPLLVVKYEAVHEVNSKENQLSQATSIPTVSNR